MINKKTSNKRSLLNIKKKGSMDYKEEYEKQKDDGIMKMATVALTRDKHTRASLVNTSTK